MHAIRIAMVLALNVVAIGTAAAQATPKSEAQTKARAKNAIVHVSNNHWLDVRVYAVTGGRTWRLGTVTTYTTGTFTLPGQFVDPGHDTQFVAYPIGARTRVTTPGLLLTPGDVIEWRVENNLNLSSLFVYGSG
jgi:hypothetical protein